MAGFSLQLAGALDLRGFAPWSLAGGPDPDYDDRTRHANRALLTDPLLLTGFRRRFPEHRDADYDEMVRLLDYVWDCPDDGAANATGFRCAGCGRRRANATLRFRN